MTRTRLYLLRHGQVEGFGEKRYNGQGDVSLTPTGRDQSMRLRDRLKDNEISAVYSSDLSRCLFGADLLAGDRGLKAISLRQLRELHIGYWEGRTWKELQESYPKEWQGRLDDIVHYRVPGGESVLDLAERLRPAIRQILSAHPGEEVAVVGHGGVNRVILLDAIGAPLKRLFSVEQDYGCLNIIDYYDDGISVVKLLNG